MRAMPLVSATLDGSSSRDVNDFPTISEEPANPALIASSDLVTSVFGETFGMCWGEYSCSHTRIPGRLYACTKSILFYTNVLGFERKLAVDFRDIETMELHRTTSIRIRTCDEEVYIFRSFRNREDVLGLLKRLMSYVKGPGERQRAISDEIPHSVSFADDVLPPALPPPSSPRRRAVSDSFLRNFVESPFSRDYEAAAAPPTTALNRDESFVIDAKEETAWEKAQSEFYSKFDIKGIDELSIPCSIDTFYHLFLRDDAEHSLDSFQRDVIQDRDVSVTKWNASSQSKPSRTLKFVHPIANTMGIGPPSAKTERVQTLRRFGSYGTVLNNVTHVSGIPASDCFHVEDQWLLRAAGEQTTILSTRFAVRFTKSIPFKAFIIEKSIKKETMKWYDRYSAMLLDTLNRIAEGSPLVKEDVVEPKKEVKDWYGGERLVLLLLCSVIVAVAIQALFLLVEIKGLLQDIHSEAQSMSEWRTALQADQTGGGFCSE